MLLLTGTPACYIRDELKSLRFAGKISANQITDRMANMDIPDWLQSQIIEMSNYRKMDRNTCPIEQAMEAAVHRKIIQKILEPEP